MTPFRFSLKRMLASVALAAVSVAALANASPGWATAVITAMSLALLAAALFAAAGAGRSQAFAVGFLIGALGYFFLWQAETERWLELEYADLPTTRLVNRLYELVKRKNPAASAAGGAMAPGMPGGAPPSSPPQGSGMAMGMGNMGFFNAVPPFTPDIGQFQKTAHWLIALYLGLLGGLVARKLRSSQATA